MVSCYTSAPNEPQVSAAPLPPESDQIWKSNQEGLVKELPAAEEEDSSDNISRERQESQTHRLTMSCKCILALPCLVQRNLSVSVREQLNP